RYRGGRCSSGFMRSIDEDGLVRDQEHLRELLPWSEFRPAVGLREKMERGRALPFGGGASEDSAEQGSHAFLFGSHLADLGQRGERARLFHHERGIQREQRLLGNGGLGPAFHALV